MRSGPPTVRHHFRLQQQRFSAPPPRPYTDSNNNSTAYNGHLENKCRYTTICRKHNAFFQITNFDFYRNIQNAVGRIVIACLGTSSCCIYVYRGLIVVIFGKKLNMYAKREHNKVVKITYVGLLDRYISIYTSQPVFIYFFTSRTYSAVFIVNFRS